MSEVTKENADTRQLYAAAKAEAAGIENEAARLESQIDADERRLTAEAKQKIKEERGNVPPEVAALLNEKDALLKSRAKLSWIRLAVAAGIIAVLVLFKLLVYDFVLIGNFITYLLIIAVAGVSAFFAVSPGIKKIEASIAELNGKDEMKAFVSVVHRINEKLAADIKWVREEKYSEEFSDIKRRKAAVDAKLRRLRPQMIKIMYGNAVIFYFEKFAWHNSYEIKLDGVTVSYSSGDKLQIVRVNPGYHSIELIYIYTDAEGYKKQASWSFQVGEENLPLCITSKKVDYFGTCREVPFEELEKIMKKELL